MLAKHKYVWKKKTRENLLLEVAFDSSPKLVCLSSIFGGIFIGIKRPLKALVISENS
jgi:TRAP-type C4-dicarboxylate transport system permease large subunit